MSGYPTPALDLDTDEQRAIWFQGYVDTYLDRDARDLADVASQPDFRRLMKIAARRVGALVNRSEWARDAAVAPTTAARYLDLLETSYQLVRIDAFAVNRTKRLIKSPKAYWSDTGLCMFVAGERKVRGRRHRRRGGMVAVGDLHLQALGEMLDGMLGRAHRATDAFRQQIGPTAWGGRCDRTKEDIRLAHQLPLIGRASRGQISAIAP